MRSSPIRLFIPAILLGLTVGLLVGCGLRAAPKVDVVARIVDTDGGPRQGLASRIGDDIASTDASGSVAFPGVETPFDLLVARQDTLTLVHAFRSLHAADPELVLADPLFEALLPGWAAHTAPRTATVTVPLPFVPGPTQYAVACLESGDAPLFGCSAFLPATTVFEIAAHWYGPATISAKLHLVYVQTTAGLPSDAFGYYVGELADLTDQATPTVAPAFVEDPADRTVKATILPPSALQGTSLSALVRVSENLMMPWMVRFPVAPGSETTFVVPDIGTGAIQVVGRAEVAPCPVVVCISRSVTWRSDVRDGDVVELVPPTPPAILAPVDPLATVGPTTELTLSDTMNGAVTWIASDAMSFVHPQLAVTTTDAVARLPDPSLLQVALPPQEAYLLFAVVVPDAPSAEAWLAEFGPLTVSEGNGGPGTMTSGELVITPWRSITTP